MRWLAMVLCPALAGCSVLFDPDDHLSGGGDTDGGTMDAGGGTDASTDADIPADAPATDGPAIEDGGPEGRCPAVVDPNRFCPDGVSANSASIAIPTGAVLGSGLSLAVVEDGPGMAVVSGIDDGGAVVLLYNELAEARIVNEPHDIVNLAVEAEALTGVRPTGARAFAARRVAASTIGVTFLSDDTGADSSDVWVAGVLDDDVESIANLSGATPVFGEVALSGPAGGAGARHFWRDLPAGGGMVLASLPFDDWSSGRWRATQTGVEDLEDSVPMRGSDGAFVATIGDEPNEVQLWSGLGADADMPTSIDSATPVIDYAYTGTGTVVDFDFAWVAGDRYALALVVQDGLEYGIGLVRAECAVSCTGDDPEVCSTSCSFGPYESVVGLGEVDDARVAVAGAGPSAVAVAVASAVDGDHWTVTLSIVDSFNFAEISDPAGVPFLETVGDFFGSLVGFRAASLTVGGTVDVVAGWLDGASNYDLVTFQPCLCE